MSSKENESGNPSKIVIEKDLRGYFFERLYKLNKEILYPVPEPTIFYSSEVLDRLSNPKEFFEITEGKMKEKVLGVKLLEATEQDRSQQKRDLKDVGDTALLICGKFAKSVDKKILDIEYYEKIGKMAYNRLNKLVPVLMDTPGFYEHMHKSFNSLTQLISNISDDQYFPYSEMLIAGNNIKKTS